MVKLLKQSITKAYDLGVFDATELSKGSNYAGKVRNHSMSGAELVWSLLGENGKVKHRRILKTAYEAGKTAYRDEEEN